VKIEEGSFEERSRAGGGFSNEQVREDCDCLWPRYFTDVQVDINLPQGQGGYLHRRKSFYQGVLILGNDKVKLDDIKEKVTLTPVLSLNLKRWLKTQSRSGNFIFLKDIMGQGNIRSIPGNE